MARAVAAKPAEKIRETLTQLRRTRQQLQEADDRIHVARQAFVEADREGVSQSVAVLKAWKAGQARVAVDTGAAQ